MANVFIKPGKIAATALGLLQREIILPRLITRRAFADFVGSQDDTVTIKIPARTTARVNALRATGAGRQVTTDTLTQHSIAIKLENHVYNAIAVTDEELTLDITDFGAEILTPQVRAVAEELENGAADMMETSLYDYEVAFDSTDPQGTMLDVRKILNDENVEKGGRICVVGSAIERIILGDDYFNRYDYVGPDANSALAEATIRRAGGFTFVQSNAIDPHVAFAFHPSAYSMATAAPKIPSGVPFGAQQGFDGLAMRWIRDYDSTNLEDRSIVSAYSGYKATYDNATRTKLVRAVKLTLAPFGS